MHTLSKLVLSTAFKRAQRALAQCLEPGGNAMHGPASGLQALLQTLGPDEWSRLVRWLGWRRYAARLNNNPALVLRIDTLRRALESNTASSPLQPRNRVFATHRSGPLARSA